MAAKKVAKKVVKRRESVERTRAGGEWTEARFWSFLRSNLRSASRKWPPLVRHALHACRREYHGENKRQKWEHQCAGCNGWFMRKDVEVDHIIPCGSLKSYAELPGFCERMFVEASELRVLCNECHNLRRGEDPEIIA